jgi:hypothetical protein
LRDERAANLVGLFYWQLAEMGRSSAGAATSVAPGDAQSAYFVENLKTVTVWYF